MAEACLSTGCPEVIRLALQDPCTGAPVAGVGNGMVMRCQRNVTVEPVVQDGEESRFTSDCGIPDIYILDSQVEGYTVSFESARISPELHALLQGYELLQDGGVNVGFIEEAVAGCNSQLVRPTFIVELFYQVRNCDSAIKYLRRVLQGVRFNPVENDKETQIGFERYTGRSFPTLTSGLINPDSETAGPYQDFPADIYTELGALDADHLNVGTRFADSLADPTNGITLTAGTCFTATVPADVVAP